MSVVIKGVNVPKSCHECFDCLDNPSDNAGYHLVANCHVWNGLIEGKEIKTIDDIPKDKRADDCPLIPLPQKHGRLIDADSFLAKLHNICFYDGDDRTLIYKLLENAPTIIEAEDGDDQRDTDSQKA